MANDYHKEEVHRRSIHAEQGELQEATGHFIRSIFRTGVSVALLPVTTLSPKPRQHFQTAGRELAYGFASLVHEFATGLEEIATDARTPAHTGDDPHPNGEQE